MANKATCVIEGSVIQFNRPYQAEIPKKPKEAQAAYEDRTWINRLHLNGDGNVTISAAAIVDCIKKGVKYDGGKIPGKGGKGWFGKFNASLSMLEDPVILGIDGKPMKPGDAKKVSIYQEISNNMRAIINYPTLLNWRINFWIYVLDDTITETVFRDYTSQAGMFVGLGVKRPENGGQNGRFTLKSMTWESCEF